MLDLKYDQDTKFITITNRDDQLNWPNIRAVFDSGAQEIIDIGPDYLVLPVWSFLACRRSFSYIIKRYSIHFTVNEALSNILKIALENESTYSNNSKAPSIVENSLFSKLKLEGFKRKLTQEQLRNVLFLCRFNSGATFSVPGAGKTTEALAFFCFKKMPGDKLLVVCPKNAFIAWEEQVNDCLSPNVEVSRLIGGENNIKKVLRSKTDIFLISYQQFSLVKNLIASLLVNYRVFMYLDESHKIKKGKDGTWCNSILSVSHLPINKLIMSGTPLPNSVTDLIPQFNFIYPEIDANEETIKGLIQPVFVRTTKEELHLPPIHRYFTEIHLKPEQRRLYDLLRSEEARQISQLSPKDKSRLRTIGNSAIKLLQLVSNPALLSSEDFLFQDEMFSVLAEGDGSKVEYACFKARKLAQQGLKTIIWSNFVANVEAIAFRLADLGAEYIHGGVEAGSDEELFTRESKLKKFHKDPNTFVLVANPAACSEGISLHTVCHNAIYIDRTYNVAQYLQSEDRIHRLGLPNEVITNVEILISPKTIDDSIKRRLSIKVNRMAKVLNDDSLNIEPTDPDEEEMGFEDDDVRDFLNHLNGY